jgi:hypothetical protein
MEAHYSWKREHFSHIIVIEGTCKVKKKENSVALSPRANYTTMPLGDEI